MDRVRLRVMLRVRVRGKNSERPQFQYFAYGRIAGKLKRASITQNEMKSGEGYSK